MHATQQNVVVKKHPWLRSTTSRRIIHITLLVPAATSLIGLFISNAIPSLLSVYIALVMGFLLGSFWMLVVIKGYREGCYRNTRQPLMQKPWVGSGSAFCLGLMFGYYSFAWATPWLLNLVIGTSSEQLVTTIGWESGGARSCSRPDIGKNFLTLAPRALCMPSDGWRKIPAGTRLRLVGPASVFGINVNAAYIVAGRQ